MNITHNYKQFIALSIYLTALFAANTLGIKIMPLLNGHISVAIFWFPIVFLMTDVIGEVYGKETARQFVWAGFISILLFLCCSVLSLALPWSNDGLWAKIGYNLIFGVSLRISLASLVAYVISEFQDIWSFFFVRKLTGSKYFWLRSNLAAIWSEFLDSIIFMLIAFAGIYPAHTLWSIILSWWLFKVLMSVCFTPMSYLAIKLLKYDNSHACSSH